MFLINIFEACSLHQAHQSNNKVPLSLDFFPSPYTLERCEVVPEAATLVFNKHI